MTEVLHAAKTTRVEEEYCLEISDIEYREVYLRATTQI